MRLLTKTSYYQFLLSIFVLGITGVMMFIFLRREISAEIEEQLELQADLVWEEVHQGKQVIFPLVVLTKGDINLMKIPKAFKDTLIYDRLQKETEGYYYFAESKRINGSYYRIKVMTTYIGWENYSRTISYIFVTIAIMLVIIGTLINYFVNRKLWSPFLINLRRVSKYSLNSSTELQLTPTNVKEFQEMNQVLADLAASGKKEYAALKQFTENASHEIQTPLAIIKARLESIGQFPLEPKLTTLLNDAKVAVSRLSKVNKGLLLLAKLENGKFADQSHIELDEVIIESYSLLEDLFQQKRLAVTLDITKKSLYSSKSLVDILLSNFLSNMIQHTPAGGRVAILLNSNHLRLTNEAPPLTFTESELFKRFTKGLYGGTGQNGLGLSIVKQICIHNGWSITYAYEHGSHIFTVEF